MHSNALHKHSVFYPPNTMGKLIGMQRSHHSTEDRASLLSRLSAFGAPQGDTQMARKWQLTNGVILLTCLILFVGACVVYTYGSARVFLNNGSFILVGLGLYFYRPRSNTPRAVLTSLWVLAYILWASTSGTRSGMHTLLLMAPALLFFMFELRQARGIAVATAVSCALLLWIGFFFPYENTGEPKLAVVLNSFFSDRVLGPRDYQRVFNVSASMAGLYLVAYTIFAALDEAEAKLAREFARSERLLAAMLPVRVAARLKEDPSATVAEHVEHATILFADLAGFTAYAAERSPDETVAFLNRIFSAFDACVEAQGLEKIKTIGDAYMVAGGLGPGENAQEEKMARLALEMIETAQTMMAGKPLSLRIGMHRGPVTAGVIGQQRPFYDVWGDTVNVAARMESHGEAGKVQVTPELMQALRGSFELEPRAALDVAGKGRMSPYWLVRRKR